MTTATQLEKPLGEILSDRTPTLGRLLFFLGLIISAYDNAVLQKTELDIWGVRILGFALLISGVSLYFISRFKLGKFFSEAIRIKPEHRLITSGVYRYIRHPIYLGEILYFLSIPMIFISAYGFIIMLVSVPMLINRIGFEEKALFSEFGQAYTEYARRTKRLIPFIY